MTHFSLLQIPSDKTQEDRMLGADAPHTSSPYNEPPPAKRDAPFNIVPTTNPYSTLRTTDRRRTRWIR